MLRGKGIMCIQKRKIGGLKGLEISIYIRNQTQQIQKKNKVNQVLQYLLKKEEDQKDTNMKKKKLKIYNNQIIIKRLMK